MILQHVFEMLSLLDRPDASGTRVAERLRSAGPAKVTVTPLEGPDGTTDHLRILIPGRTGKHAGGDAATLGIIGRLGGVGARPNAIGLVSDGDGAVAALAAALRLAEMTALGDQLAGDVIITTHVCPDAPVRPHQPVPFMGSPVDSATMNRHEVTPEMDAILSIDTTRGNRILNHRGIAITPTVRAGWILRVSDDLLDVLGWVTGSLPRVLPITMQDITPYGNGVYHLNSILQPAVATSSPVVGVALTAEVAVPGSATGASQLGDIAHAGQFAIEVAKRFGRGELVFHDQHEFDRLVDLYGSMGRLQGQEVA